MVRTLSDTNLIALRYMCRLDTNCSNKTRGFRTTEDQTAANRGDCCFDYRKPKPAARSIGAVTTLETPPEPIPVFWRNAGASIGDAQLQFTILRA